MERGYWKRWRKMEDCVWYFNPYLHLLANYILDNVVYKPTVKTVKTGKGYQEVKLNPGQAVFGRNAWAKKFSEKPITLYKRLLKLKKSDFCNIESNNQYSIISVTNWGIYQGDGNNESNMQVTCKYQPSNMQVTHVKNTKNTKNTKKTTTEPSSSFLKNNDDLKFRIGSPFGEIIESELFEFIEQFGIEEIQYHISGLEKQGYMSLDKFDKPPIALLISQIKKKPRPDYTTPAERKKMASDARNDALTQKLAYQKKINDQKREEESEADNKIYNEAIKDQSLLDRAVAYLESEYKGKNKESKIYKDVLKYKIIELYKKKG